MLNVIDDGGKRYGFYIFDVHHHIGGEETVRNLNPKEPNGTYDFYRAIIYGTEYKKGLLKELEDKSRYKFYIQGEVAKGHKIVEHIVSADPKAEKTFKDTLIIDKSVAFPMMDTFRKNEGVEYKASNRRLVQVCRLYPNSLRFVSFGRVNPRDDAINEIHRFVREDGHRGLKLHTKSEKFDLLIPEVKNIIKVCAEHNIPVIFHTDWASEREKIYEQSVHAAIELCNEGNEKALYGLKLIIGHCGWSWNHRLFEIIGNPHIYAETSGMHGDGVFTFFETARESFTTYAFENTTLPLILRSVKEPEKVRRIYRDLLNHTTWSKKIIFGSDIPFLNQNNVIDLIITLLRRDLNMNPIDISNILGINALRIIPPGYTSDNIKLIKKSSTQSLRRYPSNGLHSEFIKQLIPQIEHKLNIVNFEPIIETWPLSRLRNECVIVISDRAGNSSVLLFSHIFNGDLESIVPLNEESIGMLSSRVMEGNRGMRERLLKINLGTDIIDDGSMNISSVINNDVLSLCQVNEGGKQ